MALSVPNSLVNKVRYCGFRFALVCNLTGRYVYRGNRVKYITLVLVIFVCTFVQAEEYTPGQIWKYKARTPETESTLMILKVEEYEDLGQVVHVRVDGINLVNPLKGNEIDELPHLPFKKSAIDSSVTKLIDFSDSIPNFDYGYSIWKSAYDSGQAGAFETDLKDTLQAMLGAEWVERE